MNHFSEEDFERVIKEIVKTYSSAYGCLVQLKSKKKRIPYSLCISSIRNEGIFVPKYCILWDENQVLYKGKLRNKNLYNKLVKLGVCCFEFTNVENMELNIPGYTMCYGCRESCKVKNCKCFKEEYWQQMQREHPELCSPVVVMTQPESKKMIFDAWTAGWKATKRRKITTEGKQLANEFYSSIHCCSEESSTINDQNCQ